MTLQGKSIAVAAVMAAALLTACRSGRTNFFDSEDLKPIQGEVFCPDLQILNPRGIYMIGDELLVADKHDGKLFSKVSVKDPSDVERMLNVGNGPDEFLAISGIFEVPMKGEVCITDQNKRSLSFYALDGGLEISENTRRETVSARRSASVMTVVPFGDKLIANGNFGENMLVCLDYDLNVLQSFGLYPGDRTGVGTREFFMKNQTLLAADGDGRHCVAAGIYSDWLAFFRQEGEAFSLQNEYFSADSAVESYGSESINAVRDTDQTIRHYKAVCATSKYFYALYWGIPSPADEHQACKVYRFSLDGKFRGGYVISQMLDYIAVDDSDSYMYAIGEDASLLKFAL